MDSSDETSTGDPSKSPTASYALPPGSRVGPYHIVGTIGHGGMGQVFLGDDPRLHRRVALKSLFAGPAGTEDRTRILQEARAAAQVNHPNVATVHDIIEHGARAFIVMEYVEGESLSAVLRRQRLEPDRVAAIGVQLAAAVAAAHAKGVIHRDLKPGNIQLTPAGVAKILDFGVSGTTAAFVTATSSATDQVTGRYPGTRGYMPPEQLLGGRVDERSDVFSLGVVLFEMATGEHAFNWIDELELARAILQPVRRADDVDSRVPAPLATVIAKALAPEPSQRFQTAADLGAALQTIERASTADVGTSVRSSRRVARSVLMSVPSIAIAATFFGFFTSKAFDLTTGRFAPFNREPVTVWIALGFQSLVTPAIYIGGLLVVGWGLLFAIRLLCLIGPVDRLVKLVQRQLSKTVATIGLDDPNVFAQAVAAVGVVALLLIVVRFSDLLAACLKPISDTTSAALDRLRLKDDDFTAALYRFSLDVVVLMFALALIRIRRLRRRQPKPQPGWQLLPIVTLLIVTLLFIELPYRLIWKNGAERVDFSGERCYELGRSGDQGLIFCPDRTPPRNRTVSLTDPALRRLNVVESIFTKGSP